jgi:hypothetical protein
MHFCVLKFHCLFPPVFYVSVVDYFARFLVFKKAVKFSNFLLCKDGLVRFRYIWYIHFSLDKA